MQDTWVWSLDVGKIPWRRKWLPTPVFLPVESHGQRRLVGYSPWGFKELGMTERLTRQQSIQQHFPFTWKAIFTYLFHWLWNQWRQEQCCIFLYIFYLFIGLSWVLVAAHGILIFFAAGRIFSFSFWTLSCGTPDLVLWPEIEPRALNWEHRVLDTGPPGKFHQASLLDTKEDCPGSLHSAWQGTSKAGKLWPWPDILPGWSTPRGYHWNQLLA